MAIFDENVKLASGSNKKLRIPGGSDMTLYLNGTDTGYRLGNDGKSFYKKSSGNLVAKKLSVKDFAKLHLWYLWFFERIFVFFSENLIIRLVFTNLFFYENFTKNYRLFYLVLFKILSKSKKIREKINRKILTKFRKMKNILMNKSRRN